MTLDAFYHSTIEELKSDPRTCVGCAGKDASARCAFQHEHDACQLKVGLRRALIDHIVEIARIGMACKQEAVAADTIRLLIRLAGQ